MAPLPARRALAPCPRPGTARHRGPGLGRVCFDAPTVELFEQRAEALHPALGRLGPDLLKDPVDIDETLRRLRDPSRADLSIAEALLDQRALAGIGNEVKNEVLWQARVSPWTPVRDLDDAALGVLIEPRPRRPARGRRDRPPAPPRLPAGRTSVPALRGHHSRRAPGRGTCPRLTFWCPRCQPDPR